MSNQTFTCNTCRKSLPVNHNGDTGYGRKSPKGPRYCYSCIAIEDLHHMRETGTTTLYYCNEVKDGRLSETVQNWPGSLSFEVTGSKTGFHNMAGERIDFWFVLDGQYWHGVQIDSGGQLAQCKRTKAPGPALQIGAQLIDKY